MQDVRKLFELRSNYLYIDERKIDIYSYPTEVIPDWHPDLELPDFSQVPVLYLDIETYSDNRMVLEYFVKTLRYGTFKPKTDRQLLEFIIKSISDTNCLDHDERFMCCEYLRSLIVSSTEYDWAVWKSDYDYELVLVETISSYIKENFDVLASYPQLIDNGGALDPGKGRIVLIGLMNHKGKPYIIDCEALGEGQGISRFYDIVLTMNPNFLVHFNGFSFDMPFIESRAAYHGIASPFWQSDNPTVFRTAQLFGQPVEYRSFWLNKGTTAIIDLYHQSLSWDFVARKLVEFSLKKIPLQLGLRKEERLVLSFDEMCECVKSGDLTKLKEYLVYDLEDSKLIGEFLIPDIYYQKEILEDWNFQSLSTGGFGTKWNDKLIKEYRKQDINFDVPSPDAKLSFEGGLVGGTAGLYRNVSKIDVASLYPTIMLLYMVCSYKDTDKIILKILKFLKSKRLSLKAVAGEKKGTPEGNIAKQRQGALKVMINSCFAGETLVTTSKGIFPIAELVGKNVQVVNRDGNWSDVQFNNYGHQQLWNVTLRKGSKKITIQTTAEHRWLASSRYRLDGFNSGRNKNFWWDELTTESLKEGMIIPYVQTPKPSAENKDYFNGVVHGIIYGDGTYHKHKYSKNRFSVALANGKKELEQYFHKANSICWISTIELPREDLWARVSIENLSNMNLKEVPKGQISYSYILGFVRGLLATDGNICKRDGMTLISGKKEVCDWVEKWGSLVGFDFKSQGICSKAGRISDFGTHQSITNYDVWNLKFDQSSLISDDFLRDTHREIYISRQNKKNFSTNMTWQIEFVEKTNQWADVYCCIEPLTSYFMLHGGILTGNCYGALGVQQKEFNDYVAAAMVTAYGRAILRKMIEILEGCGAKIASFDTDGVYFTTGSFEKNKEAWQICQSKMPGNEHERVMLEYEVEALAFYVPPSKSKKDESDDDGLRKNYIIVFRDGKMKANGKFRKRDKCVLEKTFTPNLVKHYLEGTHKAFYREITGQLMSKTYPVENLSVTRKIKANEKRLVELELGLIGQVVTIWKGEDEATFSAKTGKKLKKTKSVWTDDSNKIDWFYYVSMVNDMYLEFLDVPKH